MASLTYVDELFRHAINQTGVMYQFLPLRILKFLAFTMANPLSGFPFAYAKYLNLKHWNTNKYQNLFGEKKQIIR